jgi:hypothetical protein
MKKQKTNKIRLNKSVVSKFEVTNIHGGVADLPNSIQPQKNQPKGTCIKCSTKACSKNTSCSNNPICNL